MRQSLSFSFPNYLFDQDSDGFDISDSSSDDDEENRTRRRLAGRRTIEAPLVPRLYINSTLGNTSIDGTFKLENTKNAFEMYEIMKHVQIGYKALKFGGIATTTYYSITPSNILFYRDKAGKPFGILNEYDIGLPQPLRFSKRRYDNEGREMQLKAWEEGLGATISRQHTCEPSPCSICFSEGSEWIYLP